MSPSARGFLVSPFFSSLPAILPQSDFQKPFVSTFTSSFCIIDSLRSVVLPDRLFGTKPAILNRSYSIEKRLILLNGC